MAILNNIYLKFSQNATDRVLDGNTDGKVYSSSWNGGDYQRWLLEDLGDGYHKITQKATRRVLDGNTKGEVYTLSWNGGDYQRWKLEDLGDGYYRITQKATSRVLDGGANGDMYTLPWNGGDYQRWSLTIVADKWKTVMDNIVYDATQPPTNTDPVEIISNQVIKNDSPAKITETIEHSITKESTFEWGLTQTLKVGMSAEFEAGVPFIGSAKTTVSVELGLEAHQTWSETVSETYTIHREVSLEERSAIQVNGYIDWADDFSTPFTLEMWVSATADGPSGTDQPLTTDQLKTLLQEGGFNGKIVDDKLPNKLLISLSGSFTGSYGMTTHVNITEIPLK